MNCTILNIRNSITNIPIIYPKIIQHKNYHWKTQPNNSYKQVARLYNSQNIQELKIEVRDSKQFTHQAIAKMEGQIDYLVAEFNKIEEEEF
jgi:hypothetical protein